MNRIAIVTLTGYFNYGNRLQNYALQEVLRSLDFDVETIKNDTRGLQVGKNEKKGALSRFANKSPLLIYKILKNKADRYFNRKIIGKRTKVFKQFTLNHIREIDFIVADYNTMENLSEGYDYFVVGSDQVWNPDYISGTSINFLTFAPEHKRIAYAPSFGVSKVKSEYIERYKKWISGMHRLSVREDDGAKIIKELTGREAPVLVDPTLLLTKEQWLSISKEADNKPKGKYMLTYFLGGVPSDYKKQIRGIARKNNLEVRNLGDIREKETYITGPSEFVDYINSCSILCTDSFHGAVFSILMGKPFIVYERMGTSLSMFSRINTLLNKFDLNCRKAENIKTDEDVFNIDYSHIPPILEAERRKSINYLKEALNIKDEN